MFVLLTLLLALLRLQPAISSSNQTLLFGSSIGGSQNKLTTHNLKNFLATLTSQASKTNFYNTSFVDSHDQIFGLYLCRGDIDHQSCSDCVNYAAEGLVKENLIFNSTTALYQYEYCMVRYSNEPIVGKLDLISYSASWSDGNSSFNRIWFAEVVGSSMNSLAVEAANDKGGEKFATKIVKLNGYESLYTMAQCTWDLTACECNKCLSKAIGYLPLQCGDGKKAKVYLSSCMIRYQAITFLNNLKSQLTLASE